ncbi:YfiR family protein [Massilia sp. PAMC28688]|uniref:YfiR family protein n=1 Tax=Massilia sp. PAMC28688 TaxID=2861283 RepID=UPI001C62C93A|nr:YfiR family protein [Massilia sp. PAMC28688]QYF93412.1 YfiR family protein [Massilia sp. PAMC28688]
MSHGASAPTSSLPRQGRRRLVLLAAAASLLGSAVLAAPAGTAPERKVKAAFLYKFLGYTEFPATAFADAAAPVVIGVVDAEGVAAELSRIVVGRTVQGRPIAVKAFREQEAPAGVHLLFVGGSDSARVRSVIKAAQPAPMLVVTEAENGLRQGSVINFKIVDARVRFDISLEAADKHSVKLSSRLLTVASHVHKGTP